MLVATRRATEETRGILGSNNSFVIARLIGEDQSHRTALVPFMQARGYDSTASIVFRYSQITISITQSITGMSLQKNATVSFFTPLVRHRGLLSLFEFLGNLNAGRSFNPSG